MNRSPKEILEFCRWFEKDSPSLVQYAKKNTYGQRRSFINDRLYAGNIHGPDIQVRDQIRRWLDWKLDIPQTEVNNYAEFFDFWDAEELWHDDVKPKGLTKTPKRLPDWEVAFNLHSIAITLENTAKFRQAMTRGSIAPSQRTKVIEAWAEHVNEDRWRTTKACGNYTRAVASLVTYFEDRYDLSERTDFGGAILEFWRDEVRTPPPRVDMIQPSPTSLPTQKEITMDIITVTTKTLVNGNDVSKMADSEVYDLIAAQERHIKTLEAIENKPKKLMKELDTRRAGIAALVAYLDSKE